MKGINWMQLEFNLQRPFLRVEEAVFQKVIP